MVYFLTFILVLKSLTLAGISGECAEEGMVGSTG